MTEPKVATLKRKGGSGDDARWYVHPVTGEKVPGVTSVVGCLPKGFLKYWAAKKVAEEAVSDVAGLAARVERSPEAAVEWLKKAPYRDTAEAARLGTDAHELFEAMAKGARPDRSQVSPDMEPHWRNFGEFLAEFEPQFEHLEQTVWSGQDGYAGTFDAIATIRGSRVLLDWKTTRSGVHPEVALQLAAYRYAGQIITPDGQTADLGDIDACAVFWSRPEGWDLVPVHAGLDIFESFRKLRGVFDWDTSQSKRVIGPSLRPATEGEMQDAA